jgi:hypothetical protein
MSRSAAAIVTTLRDAGSMLESFVAYHLGAGFAHLFLFFDDPADPDLARFARHPKVTAIAHDNRLRESWTTLPEYPGLAGFIDSEVMARQTLNAALAIDMARDKGFDCLLHIDVDELFFPIKLPVPEHFFEALSQPYDALYYENLEAVPEKPDIKDPFLEVDLFKLSSEAGPDNEAVRRILAVTPQIPPRRFHFYANGKSAGRLAAPALRPDGVHRFGGTDVRRGWSADAYILHYACCGFDSFWRKYALLGAFADSWLDSIDIRSSIGPLHLDARDVVARGDRDAALAFYRQRIAIEDPNIVQALVEHRILVRVPEPRQFLQSIARPMSG